MNRKKHVPSMVLLVVASAFCFLTSKLLVAQQPQAQSGQPIYQVNAEYVNGVAPGYWPTAGSGLTLKISAGTAWCGNPPTQVNYAGGTLTLPAWSDVYVYLDPANDCAPNSELYVPEPIAPSLSAISGGTLAAATYYVKITYVTARGESIPSPEASQSVLADQVLSVASPVSYSGATGWNVYVGTSSGSEALQNPAGPIAIGTNWSEPATGMNYLGYLPPPGSSSTGLLPGEIPIAYVTTNGSGITSLTDLRTQSVDPASHGPVFRVDLMPGANLGAKLAACFAQLPAAGGTCDARALTGNQTITTNPFSGLPEYAQVTVLFGPSVITTVPLVMPSNIQQGLIIRGAGSYATFFSASAANQPIFEGSQSGGTYGTVCDQCYLGEFAVVANASGSTGPAIDTTGFRDSTFEDIQYFDSSRGWLSGAGNWNSFFHFAAYPEIDYANRIIHPIIDGGGNPATVFLFDTGGTGNASNRTNVALIQNPFIYETSSVTTVFDLQHSGGVTVRGGLVEQNTNAVILVPGSYTTFEDVWVDTNPGATLVAPRTDSSGASNSVTIRDNVLATSWSFTIPSWSSDWQIIGNHPTGNLNVTDSGTNDLIESGGAVNKIQVGSTSGPTWTSGSSAPSGSCSPNGSIYSNTGGSSGSTLYACVAGAWADAK